MKGQVRVGNLAIAFVILAFVLLGSFTLYSNFLVDYEATPDASIENSINELYASSQTNADSLEDSSEDISTQFDSGDNIFIRGSKAVSQVSNTGKIAIGSIGIAQNATGDTQLPSEFFDTTAILISLLFVFAVAGALWRYDLLQ